MQQSLRTRAGRYTGVPKRHIHIIIQNTNLVCIHLFGTLCIINNFVCSFKVLVTNHTFPYYEVNKGGEYFSNSVVFVGRQEEMMTGSNVSSMKRSLEDLFRPPLDLMFHGTFQNVRYILWLIRSILNL
jgi:hypothetical protein